MAVDRRKIQQDDEHWEEVIALAEKYGFICQTFAESAVLVTNRRQLMALGEENFILHKNNEMLMCE